MGDSTTDGPVVSVSFISDVFGKQIFQFGAPRRRTFQKRTTFNRSVVMVFRRRASYHITRKTRALDVM